jgi:hypothetical protein
MKQASNLQLNTTNISFATAKHKYKESPNRGFFCINEPASHPPGYPIKVIGASVTKHSKAGCVKQYKGVLKKPATDNKGITIIIVYICPIAKVP